MDHIQQAILNLNAGLLVAIPTETVYGLAADPRNKLAVARVYETKGRPTHHPLIIHLSDPKAMQEWAIDIPDLAWKLADACWPGPLTLILKKHPDVLPEVTGQQDTVALRVPNHPITLELLQQWGSGLVAPSANRYGHLSPTTPEHVLSELGNKVSMILDGGRCTLGLESTILSLVHETPIILREGLLDASTLSKILQQEVISRTQDKSIRVPGSQDSHYAPSTPLYLIEELSELTKKLENSSDQKIALMTIEPLDLKTPNRVNTYQMPNDPAVYAHELYYKLHEIDRLGFEVIWVIAPPQKPGWEAIQDRLQRASH